MYALKQTSDITELSFDPESLASGVAPAAQQAQAVKIRVIIVGKGGACKKYTAADGEVVWVCGG